MLLFDWFLNLLKEYESSDQIDHCIWFFSNLELIFTPFSNDVSIANNLHDNHLPMKCRKIVKDYASYQSYHFGLHSQKF